MSLEIINPNSYVNMLLWTIPNYLLSLGMYTYYLSYVPIHHPRIVYVNLVNIRQVIIRTISNRIETVILGLILPLFSVGIYLGHVVNCLIVAEVLYSGYDIHSRLRIYRRNLLQISTIGIPLTLVQVLYGQNWFIHYHVFNITLVIYSDWLTNMNH